MIGQAIKYGWGLLHHILRFLASSSHLSRVTCPALRQLCLRVSKEYISTVVFAILIRTATAQNPVSELGSWPDGAVTLFGGLYCGVRSISNYNHDALPPICLAPVWHMIPGFKEKLRGSGKMGNWFNMLVLGCKERSGLDSRQEWDAVIVPVPDFDQDPENNEKKLVFTGLDQGEVKVVITVIAGDPDIDVEFKAFDHVTKILFDGLPDKDASKLMRRWHAMKQYLMNRQADMVPSNSTEEFEELREYWLDEMTSPPVSQSQLDKMTSSQASQSQPPPGYSRLSKRSIKVFFPEAPCQPGELAPNAGIDETSTTLADLAIMLAYNKALIREQVASGNAAQGSLHAAPRSGNAALAKTSPVVNPLLPSLWLWKEDKLGPTNNLCITFPPVESFPVTDMGGVEGTRINLSLDLHPRNGYQEWEVDGFNIYGSGNIPWIIGTFCGCIMSFFLSLASNLTPTLSAAIALYFSIPYSCDNNYRDMGWPPSWNGRVRLRWGDPDPCQGYACGIFSGTFRKRMGKTGTSIHRASLVLLVCALSWIWKLELRAALGFQNTGLTQWVQIVGFGLEIFAGVGGLINSAVLFSWKMNKHAFLCIAGGLFGIINAIFMWMWIFRGIGLLPLRLIGELGGMGVFSLFHSAQMVGTGYVNAATTVCTIYSWMHYIALSCVIGDSRG